jgi:serine/threonine protein kinase
MRPGAPNANDAPANPVGAVRPRSRSTQPSGVPFACSPPCRAVRAGRAICFTFYRDRTLARIIHGKRLPLTPGTRRIGVYEITGQIGAGGMGEVYRARDTRLNRDVAMKVLPDLFANDVERLARFMREAQTS